MRCSVMLLLAAMALGWARQAVVGEQTVVPAPRVPSDEPTRDDAKPSKGADGIACDGTEVMDAPMATGPGLRALRQWLNQAAASRAKDIPPTPLGKAEAAIAVALLWNHWRTQQIPQRSSEIRNHVITIGGKKMRLLTHIYGKTPVGGRSLWISMHGGGGVSPQINDQQWQNQFRLYQPAEGICIAPRAPTNHWNLWHEDHIDDFLDRLIDDCVLLHGVNPDKVYLIGYSAGGNGVYQLAPRMADRFAAASMMAGHPGNASPLGLRNLPFAICLGAEDSEYQRNKFAAEWGDKLDDLAARDRGAYPHRLLIYPNLGHWMHGKDAEALPWMAQFTRNPWPHQVVWRQSDRLHDRFYWLALPLGVAKPGLTISASVERNVITIDAPDVTRVILRLNDRMVDLDRAISVRLNGKTVFEGRVPRHADAILKSLQQRADPNTAATALLEVRDHA